MAGTAPKRFRATLERLQGNLGWTIARLPFDPGTAWKKMVRRRVVVELAGQSYRTSLFPFSTEKGYFVLVNKQMQKAAGATLGSEVDLAVAPDLEEREPEMPPELAKLLKGEKALLKWMNDSFSDSTRYEIGKWINGVKSPASRQRRAEQMAERLMLAMEGEKVLPPILDAAFREHPAARRGWNAMPPSHRRSHLLAVFYYQTPEGREKRVAKVIEECMRYGTA
jgi:uncharacterized protein YdeI (YjbR/CyaY-like superfamily)